MYKAKLSGSTVGQSGQHWLWNAGDVVDAPKGELDHVGSLEWDEKVKKESEGSGQDPEDKPLDGTVAEIKDWLDDNGVEYESNAKKAELLEILADA